MNGYKKSDVYICGNIHMHTQVQIIPPLKEGNPAIVTTWMNFELGEHYAK